MLPNRAILLLTSSFFKERKCRTRLKINLKKLNNLLIAMALNNIKTEYVVHYLFELINKGKNYC